MPRGVIPVLSRHLDQLTDPVDQIAYIIRHAVYNPGWTSNYIEPYLISMRKLFAENSHHLINMAKQLESKLSFTLTEMFGQTYRVTTKVYDINEVTKGVRVLITDSTGNLVLNTDDIRVVDDKIYIKGYNETDNTTVVEDD